jgi:peptide deformylase
MIRDIIIYPNPILRKKSKNVESFDKDLHNLLDDMYETMVSKEGVGLAAIQIGIDLNVLIIGIPDENSELKKEDLYEVINPKILRKFGEVKNSEGCLSIPDFNEDVIRAKEVEVEFYDRFGKKHHIVAKELLAIAFQHEIDHLNGHLFIEKLPLIKRKKFEKEWKKKHRKRR